MAKDELKNWWQKPYSDNMTVPQWFMFVGLMTLIAWLWTRVLKSIADNIN